MSSLERYCTDILDGVITACYRMKQVAELLLDEINNPKEYHFDAEIAEKHISFIETFCKVPSGMLGAPLKLELFQKARLEAVFGFVDDENVRQFNECLIIEGRKNGKTTECACVELDLLVNDGEGSPQIYNVATKLDQAKLGFNAADKMRRLSPLLKKHIRKRANDLYFEYNFGYIQPLASETKSLDGLDIHGAIVDELAAIKNRDLYDLIKQGMGARRQPLLFTISTNGFLRNGIFDAQYDYACGILDKKIKDEHFLPFIYELDDISEWDKEECWIKANPGLGTIKSYDYLRQMVDKAKVDLSFRPTVMVKDFNMPQTGETAWLRYEELNNEEKCELRFKYCIGGFDAADTTDLNAAVAVCRRPNDEKIYVRPMFWLPESVILERRNKGLRTERDDAPYELWAEQGLLRLCPGNKCSKQIFLDYFMELRDNEGLYPLFIGYDPWHIDDTLLARFKAEFGRNTMIPIRQGAITLSDPMKSLAADFKAHRVVYDNNPIMKWCLINTEIKTDINANIQPVKQSDSRKRIDGVAALLCAYKVLADKLDNYVELNRGC